MATSTSSSTTYILLSPLPTKPYITGKDLLQNFLREVADTGEVEDSYHTYFEEREEVEEQEAQQ